MEDKKQFDYGKTVRVLDEAPINCRPGEIASIVAFTSITTVVLADFYKGELGDQFITVEFTDGSSISMKDSYLSIVEGFDDT